jgi:hypothetical protein
MSSRLGNTDVGELFAKPASRAAGLTGALAPRPKLVRPVEETAPAEEQSPEPAAEPAGARSPRGSRARKPSESESLPTRDELATSRRLVLVYVTQADLDWVTRQRKETDRTNAQVVLASIESCADQLAAEFRASTPRASGMFAIPTAPGERGKERHVQLGLSGILPADRDVLGKLVADTDAGSLSALVRAALKLSRQAESAGSLTP